MQELLRCVWVLIRCVEANSALAGKMGQKESDVSPNALIKMGKSKVFVLNQQQNK